MNKVKKDRKQTCNIPTNPPRIPRLIPPNPNVRLPPYAQRVRNSAVDGQQGVTHHAVPKSRVRLVPVIFARGRRRKVRTAAIGEVVAVRQVGDAVRIGVGPVGGDAAVVVFEV